MTDLKDALAQIKKRTKAARHHNRMPQIKSGDSDIYEKLLDSQADVPSLVAAIEAVMKEADDADQQDRLISPDILRKRLADKLTGEDDEGD